jgi:hypothetical protein
MIGVLIRPFSSLLQVVLEMLAQVTTTKDDTR